MIKEATKSNPCYSVAFGFEGWMLSTGTVGMAPESSILQLVCQVSLASLLRLVSFFYLNDFWNVISAYQTGDQNPPDGSTNSYGTMDEPATT